MFVPLGSIVHHKEGCSRDNNKYPETLELLPDRHSHDALTETIDYVHKLEKEIRLLKKEIKVLKTGKER